jgi:hypothetical protein
MHGWQQRTRSYRAVVITLTVATMGCTRVADAPVPDSDAGGDDGDASLPSDGGSSARDSAFAVETSSGTDGPSTSGCPTSSPIYVIDVSASISTFDPTSHQVQALPIYQCGGGAGAGAYQPFAVTHDAKAWTVDYQNGGQPTLWDLIPLDASTCPNTATFSIPQSETIFGTTLVSNAPGSASETFYVTASADQGQTWSLATLGISGVLSTVGSLSTSYALAGSADGHLYGLEVPYNVVLAAPYNIVEINPASGAETILATSQVQGTIAYARGKLFVFVSANQGFETDVYTYDFASHAMSMVTHLSSFVSGAGASTCAAPP